MSMSSSSLPSSRSRVTCLSDMTTSTSSKSRHRMTQSSSSLRNRRLLDHHLRNTKSRWDRDKNKDDGKNDSKAKFLHKRSLSSSSCSSGGVDEDVYEADITSPIQCEESMSSSYHRNPLYLRRRRLLHHQEQYQQQRQHQQHQHQHHQQQPHYHHQQQHHHVQPERSQSRLLSSSSSSSSSRFSSPHYSSYSCPLRDPDDDSRRAGTGTGYPHKQIEISPGRYMKLRGTDETADVIEAGHAALVECVGCRALLQCVPDCEFVICPDCHVLSPVGNDDDHNGGVGGGGITDYAGEMEMMTMTMTMRTAEEKRQQEERNRHFFMTSNSPSSWRDHLDRGDHYYGHHNDHDDDMNSFAYDGYNGSSSWEPTPSSSYWGTMNGGGGGGGRRSNRHHRPWIGGVGLGLKLEID